MGDCATVVVTGQYIVLGTISPKYSTVGTGRCSVSSN